MRGARQASRAITHALGACRTSSAVHTGQALSPAAARNPKTSAGCYSGFSSTSSGPAAALDALRNAHRQIEGTPRGCNGGAAVGAEPNGRQQRAFAALVEECPEDEAVPRRHSSPERQRRGLRDLPSVDEVRSNLGGGGGCVTFGGGGAGDAQSPQQLQQQQRPLDWRELVAALRAGQEREPEGAAMLTDTFQRRHTYLRMSLTERCNLRCLYCMPAEGVDLSPGAELLRPDEILRLAALFVEAGVTKIRLTGGEPTLRKDIVELTSVLSALPGCQAVGITTNGIALQRKLPSLQAAGLKLLNISLDTLRPERFEAMTRRRGLERVLATIHQAVDLGYNPVKVNVVVMRGQNEDEIADFVELTRHAPINVRFIEYMPFDGNVWAEPKMVTYAQMLEAVTSAFPQGLVRLQDPRGEVAKNFRVPGFRGSVSFVSSMTAAFCSDCNRLRLMADGNLKTCLFGANEVSLRDAMREGATDGELRTIISATVDRKKAAHAGMFEIARTNNRPMVKIGG